MSTSRIRTLIVNSIKAYALSTPPIVAMAAGTEMMLNNTYSISNIPNMCKVSAAILPLPLTGVYIYNYTKNQLWIGLQAAQVPITRSQHENSQLKYAVGGALIGLPTFGAAAILVTGSTAATTFLYASAMMSPMGLATGAIFGTLAYAYSVNVKIAEHTAQGVDNRALLPNDGLENAADNDERTLTVESSEPEAEATEQTTELTSNSNPTVATSINAPDSSSSSQDSLGLVNIQPEYVDQLEDFEALTAANTGPEVDTVALSINVPAGQTTLPFSRIWAASSASTANLAAQQTDPSSSLSGRVRRFLGM